MFGCCKNSLNKPLVPGGHFFWVGGRGSRLEMVSRRQVLPVRMRGLELMNRMDGWLVGWLVMGSKKAVGRFRNFRDSQLGFVEYLGVFFF